jgi:hypothetical protein
MSFTRFRQIIIKSVFGLTIFISFAMSLSAQTPKDEELKEAQRQNQEAQAKYYAKLAENDVWSSTLVTTLFSVVVVLVSVALQNVFLAYIEKKKWERTQADELKKWERLRDDEADKRHQEAKAEIRREARQAAGDVIRKISAATQSMIWVLWIAGYDVEHFSMKLIEEHDERMMKIYAELAASQTILASFNKNLYLKTKPLVTDIYSLDERLADKAKLIDESEKETKPAEYKKKVKDLGQVWKQIYDFSRDIPDKFADMLDVQPEESNKNKNT